MADESVELIKAAAEGGVEGFFRTICGPVVEAGEWGADLIRRQRMKTQIKTMQLAESMLRDANLSPRIIPAKTLVPLLEAASLEGDDAEEMHERWAALLANAASGSDVLPSFAGILAELSSEEAAILDELYKGKENFGAGGVASVKMAEFRGTLGLEGDELFDARLLNLDRLALCVVAYELHSDSRNLGDESGAYRRFHLERTSLGFRFVAACTPPSNRSRFTPRTGVLGHGVQKLRHP